MKEQLLKKEKAFKRKWENFKKAAEKYGKPIPPGLKEKLKERFINTKYCEYCGCELVIGEDPLYSPSIDHIKSLFKGGDNSEKNLAICCVGCNLLKGTMSIETFSDLLEAIQMSGKRGLLDRVKREIYSSKVADKLEREIFASRAVRSRGWAGEFVTSDQV